MKKNLLSLSIAVLSVLILNGVVFAQAPNNPQKKEYKGKKTQDNLMKQQQPGKQVW